LFKQFYYNASLVRVIDGDTFVYDVDLGFGISTRQTFRLRGVNCPEKRGAEKEFGNVCLSYVKGILPGESMIRTYKSDSFGRWLCDIEFDNGDLLSELLCEYGYAIPWDGSGSRPSFDLSGRYPIVGSYYGERAEREGVGELDPGG